MCLICFFLLKRTEKFYMHVFSECELFLLWWIVFKCLCAAECGDYSDEEFNGTAYLKSMKLLPNQTEHLEVKILEHHREHLWVDVDYLWCIESLNCLFVQIVTKSSFHRGTSSKGSVWFIGNINIVIVKFKSVQKTSFVSKTQ